MTFAYPSRPEKLVLRGVSLKVNAGETVAFVGPSGGGKSSLVNLIWSTRWPRDSDIGLDKSTSVLVAKTLILAIASY